jgi:SpoVK/Ycf46/Vps4 family AAA+-type ATPase
MAEKKKLEDVFKTVGLPPYTYVKPAYYGEVRADISQPGKHLLIEGPSGIGKTCVAFKVFEELRWGKDDRFSYVSCRDGDATNRIDAFFAIAGRGEIPTPSVVVIDDFHLLTTARRAEIGSALKRLSDCAFEHAAPPKAILIGIPTTGVSLLSEAYDLGPRLGTY